MNPATLKIPPESQSKSKKAAGKAQPLNDAIEADLARLATDPVVKLRKRYTALFAEPQPTAFGPDLLRRSIAHGIQRNAYGTQCREAQRLLDRAVRAMSAKSTGAFAIPRRIKPGSELVREWKGKTYRIAVTPSGFNYDGKEYSSLSEIASHITGTKWNGPRFFGLRSRVEEAVTNGR